MEITIWLMRDFHGNGVELKDLDEPDYLFNKLVYKNIIYSFERIEFSNEKMEIYYYSDKDNISVVRENKEK